jgi:hypothetical protein
MEVANVTALELLDAEIVDFVRPRDPEASGSERPTG